MAGVPVPRPELNADPGAAPPDADANTLDADAAAQALDAAAPASVRGLIEALRVRGHAAYVVGGSVRDAVLGRAAADWDLATDALPERVVEILPDAVYENRFGTVAVRRDDGIHEITTFRRDHDYADFRRPHRVEFGGSLEEDLARRDFTVNAMAWGVAAPGRPDAAGPATTGGPAQAGAAGDLGAPGYRFIDPHAGLADCAARLLRAVGDPAARFEEDALRMIRAVRLAATLGFEIEPATLAAISDRAGLAERLSGERIAMELEKLLAAERPSVGLRLLASTGLLRAISPELAAQVGIPQNKFRDEDLWDHTMRTVDASPAGRPVVRLAALLHDIGKPATLADGRFHGHEAVGAGQAAALLKRLRVPRATAERVTHLVRNHMFTYDDGWGDAAIRRFIRKVGTDALDELFLLREADDVGSGFEPGDPAMAELRRRIDEQLARPLVLERSDLAIDGFDLMTELGLGPGPALGRIIDALLERVIADPALNDRPTLLLLAQAELADEP